MTSKQSKYINMVLKKMNFKKQTSKDILTAKRDRQYEEAPKKIAKKYTINKVIINGIKCMTIENKKPVKKHLFYYHGGAYCLDPASGHWKMIVYILDHTPVKITFINYPLYPESTCLNTISKTLDVYKQLVDSSYEIILGGDSAGGGLALTLAQEISLHENLIQPDKILLFSPWLDLSIDQTISSQLKEDDLILSKDTLLQAGINYAGELSPQDKRCSPYFGNCQNLGKIGLFTGTHDILHPQASAFEESLKAQNIAIEYHCYKEMQHVWVLLPIPEANEALDKACVFIQS